MGLAFPMSATDIVALGICGARDLIGGKDDGYTPTAEDIRTAESHMSSLFG